LTGSTAKRGGKKKKLAGQAQVMKRSYDQMEYDRLFRQEETAKIMGMRPEALTTLQQRVIEKTRDKYHLQQLFQELEATRIQEIHALHYKVMQKHYPGCDPFGPEGARLLRAPFDYSMGQIRSMRVNRFASLGLQPLFSPGCRIWLRIKELVLFSPTSWPVLTISRLSRCSWQLYQTIGTDLLLWRCLVLHTRIAQAAHRSMVSVTGLTLDQAKELIALDCRATAARICLRRFARQNWLESPYRGCHYRQKKECTERCEALHPLIIPVPVESMDLAGMPHLHYMYTKLREEALCRASDLLQFMKESRLANRSLDFIGT
jgi:hypothetical protein